MTSLLKWFVLLTCVVAVNQRVADAAAPAETADATTLDETSPETTTVNREYAHDEEVAAAAVDDEVLWLEEPDGRVLVLHRTRVAGKPRGSVIVLSGPGLGSDGLSHAASLRVNLVFHGWDTYFLRVAQSSTPEAESRIAAAVALVKGLTSEGLIILIAEGSASLGLNASVGDLLVDGFVLINLASTEANRALLKDMSTRTVVLQENPASWEKKYPLAESVELQLLPRSYPRLGDGRLLRRIRGWFKRSYG